MGQRPCESSTHCWGAKQQLEHEAQAPWLGDRVPASSPMAGAVKKNVSSV